MFGDKVRSKKLAEENQIPTVKGTSGKITYKEAESFYKSLSKKASLMLKAVNGGGGRGMRFVENLDELKDAYERASSEAHVLRRRDRRRAGEGPAPCRHRRVDGPAWESC